jgi:hypothetical protein
VAVSAEKFALLYFFEPGLPGPRSGGGDLEFLCGAVFVVPVQGGWVIIKPALVAPFLHLHPLEDAVDFSVYLVLGFVVRFPLRR